MSCLPIRSWILFLSAPALLLAAAGAAGCAGPTAASDIPTPPACLQDCQDAVVTRAMRETIRVAFNLALEGGKVGPQEVMAPCPEGGKVHIFGTATTDAATGTNVVSLTYDFQACHILRALSGHDDTYELTWTGAVLEEGKISNLSGSTTALTFKSDKLEYTGNVSDTMTPVDATCPLSLAQDGSTVSGKLCDRVTGFGF